MPAGNLDWIKKAARAGRYKNGFTNVVIVQGAGWTNEAHAPAINLSGGQLILTGGTLAAPINYTVAVTRTNSIIKLGGSATNSLSGSINPRTGVFTVHFGNGERRAITAGQGVILQDTTNGAGFFLDATNAGTVILDP
jgi:hypothetical protein